MGRKRKKGKSAVRRKKAREVNPCKLIKLTPTDPTCGGRVQPRFPPRGSRREVEWVPGVVRVVFKSGVDAERFTATFSDTESSWGTSEAFAALKKLLERHGLVNYELTFSFTPPGMPPDDTPPPGRERYYTLYFPPDKDVAHISMEVAQFAGIVERVAPAPRLAPPTNPAAESLVQGSLCSIKKQWAVQRCRVEGAWNPQPPATGVSGKGVVVADIDWGFRTSHQELTSRIKLRYNSMNGTTLVNQGCQVYHGTAVLGILGAKANGVGMVGFAYEADLWAIQAATDTIDDPKFWFAAIEYVRREKTSGQRKVICLEATTTGDFNVEMDLAINKAIRDAIACNVAVCVAAGNGDKDVGFDNNGQEIEKTGSILVGATLFNPDDRINRRAPFSNWGERVVVSAPGDRTNDVSCSSGADNGYLNNFGGTSGATPKVAGTVALMLEANPTLSHHEIRDILSATGTNITDPGSKPIGTFLNAEAAVREACGRAGERPLKDAFAPACT
jgi:hypothetical protein